jgi:hypothetical protein
MIDLIGGPDRDRTDDLFHAMQLNINGIKSIDRYLGER